MMARKAEKDLWPWWSKWALLGVVLSSILTIAATLNDIY
jgi:hypothetical protein